MACCMAMPACSSRFQQREYLKITDPDEIKREIAALQKGYGQ